MTNENLIPAIRATLEKIEVHGRENLDMLLGVFIALDKLEKEVANGQTDRPASAG
jgi:hypothetical protein